MPCAPGTVWSQWKQTCIPPREAKEQNPEAPAENPETAAPLPEKPAAPAENTDDVADEQYAREVLSAVARALDQVESRQRGPDRARDDREPEELSRGPDRARDAAAGGEWGDFAISEAEEGIRPDRSVVNCEDPCEITGTSEDGHEWKHTKKCVPTDRTQYRILINGSDLVMQCSPGTAFSMETCDCTVRQIPKH